MILKIPPQSNDFCDDEIVELANIFKLLGDEKRLQIVLYLSRNGKANVSELQTLLGLSQPLVSHHLALLRSSAIVESRREGKQQIYSISPGRMEGLMNMLTNRQQTFHACDRFLECVFG